MVIENVNIDFQDQKKRLSLNDKKKFEVFNINDNSVLGKSKQDSSEKTPF